MEQRSGCHENRDRPSDFGLHRQKGEHFQYTRAKYVHGSNKGAQKLIDLVIDCKSKRSSTKNKKICDTKIMQGLCLEVLKLHQPTEAQHVRQFPKCLHGELFPNFPFSS